MTSRKHVDVKLKDGKTYLVGARPGIMIADDLIPKGVITHSSLSEEAKDFQQQKAEDSIINEAKGLVYGEKSREYGEAVDNHHRIAKIANAIKDLGDNNYYDAARIAMILTAVKLARIQGPGPLKKDSFVDLIGYTDIRWRIKSKNEQPE